MDQFYLRKEENRFIGGLMDQFYLEKRKTGSLEGSMNQIHLRKEENQFISSLKPFLRKSNSPKPALLLID